LIKIYPVKRRCLYLTGMRPPCPLISRPGKYPGTVETSSVLCYWAAQDLGLSTLELSKRLGISQPTASQSVKRGEKIVKEKVLKIMEWPMSICQYPSPTL